jgi:hypothetical protein
VPASSCSSRTWCLWLSAFLPCRVVSRVGRVKLFLLVFTPCRCRCCFAASSSSKSVRFLRLTHILSPRALVRAILLQALVSARRRKVPQAGWGPRGICARALFRCCSILSSVPFFTVPRSPLIATTSSSFALTTFCAGSRDTLLPPTPHALVAAPEHGRTSCPTFPVRAPANQSRLVRRCRRSIPTRSYSSIDPALEATGRRTLHSERAVCKSLNPLGSLLAGSFPELARALLLKVGA